LNTSIYRIHHVSILCGDLKESLSVYCDQLGQEVITGKLAPGIPDHVFVGTGSGVTVQLIRKPQADNGPAYASKYGTSIYQISYRVVDTDHAFEELKSNGVRVAWEPQNASGARHCGFYDDDGLLFELFSNGYSETGYKSKLEKPSRGTELRLHHVSILTPNMRRAQRFYEEKLGLKTVFELTKEDGGLIFMIDEAYDHWKNNFMLEIVGPPDLEPREVELLNQRGACYDHLCYIAKDVKKSWQMVIQKGGKNAGVPTRYHGTWMAWVKDINGNDLEIMQPIPKFVIDIAIERGQGLNGSKLLQTLSIFITYMVDHSLKSLKALLTGS
jgi:catechol 2,3-dioxygenase-like lactoylglutathione lyase family enzyme